MKVKHICFISDDYPSPNRMVYVFVQQLVETMIEEGIKIDVVAPQSLVRSIFRRIKLMQIHQVCQTKQGINYDVFRPYSLSFSKGNHLLYKLAKPFNQHQINKYLKKIRPQIIYGHFWSNAMKGSEYARSNNIPLFVACGEGDDALDNWASKLSEEAKRHIRKQILGVISVSSENKRKCLDYGLSSEENTIVLPNCVNDRVFHPIDRLKIREEFGLHSNDFVISYTGAFIERKGYNRLADAIDRLGDETIKVIFSGRPMDGHETDIPHCKGIIHCGPVNHDDLPKYLCSSDVFVLPTLKEGCCNSIVEALACGIPVISSNRSFNDDILNDNNSIRIDPENVEQLASSIKRIKEDVNLYKRLKKYTLSNSSNYSITVRAKSIIMFIENHI